MLLPAAGSSPLFSVRAASQADQQCSIAAAHRGSLCTARWEKRPVSAATPAASELWSRACGLAFCGSGSGGCGDDGPAREWRWPCGGSDRSDGFRRGRYERGDCFGFASRPVPCVSSHDAREGTAPSRDPHLQGACPQLVAQIQRCRGGGGSISAHAPHSWLRCRYTVCVGVCARRCRTRRAGGRAHRRLVNLVGFAFSVPKATLTYRTNLC